MVDQLLHLPGELLHLPGDLPRFRIVAAGYCLTYVGQSVTKWRAVSSDARWPLGADSTSAEILALFNDNVCWGWCEEPVLSCVT